MSQIWRGMSGGVEVLENVNEIADLPDISTINSEGVWYIESGAFAPDYIAPTNWDSTAGEFTDWFSLFDGQILVGIPDSVELHAHYDFSREDGSLPIADVSDNNFDLDQGGYSGVGGEINGNQAGVFDGVGDAVWLDDGDSIDTITFYIVCSSGDLSDNDDYTILQTENNLDNHALEWSDGNWRTYPRTSITGSSDQSSQLFTVIWDGDSGDITIRENGSETGTGTSDPFDFRLDEFGLGSKEPFSSSDFFEGEIGEVIISPEVPNDSERDEMESYLTGKWNISL